MPNRDERNKRFDDAPTFVLDVPVLNVDEIDLEVNDLRAHVSLRTELADLVKINVGVDVYLDKVKLGIKGVEAQALLTISLDKVLGTLNRALEAIDKNPQILSGITQDVDQAIGDSGQGVSQAARETEQEAERTPHLPENAAVQVGEATKETRDDRVTNKPGNVTEPVPNESNEEKGEESTSTLADLPIEEEYIDERGRIVGRARDESGNVVEEVLDEEGDVLDLSMTEEEDRESEDEDDENVDATDAARRKADELGVNLSNVKGTGSNGRVLVKDVERTARQSLA